MSNQQNNNLNSNAIALVNGERQSDYGHPYDDFSRTAKMASGLGFRFQEDDGTLRDLKAKDIPMFMVLVKLSRESHKHKEDNLVDAIGYINTLDMVLTEEQRIKTPVLVRDTQAYRSGAD